MNQATRAKLLMTLTTAMDELLDKEIDPSWGLIHIPQELGFLMAQAALLVVDVVLATEGSMDEEGLLRILP